MKLNKFMIVSIVLLAIISFGAVSAASDTTADDAVGVTEELDIGASDAGEITADGDDAISSDVNEDSKLGASAEDTLSAGSVAPTYAIDVTPDAMSGSNYVAQYGQIITVNGTIENATGDVSIRFGFSGNYYDYSVPLVDGKFSKDITDYDRVRNNYQIQVKWAGNDYYKSISWSKNIHVQMANVTANGAYYGLNPYIDVDLFDATGNVTFTLNGRNYTKKLEDGKTTQEFTNYTLGKNTVTMIYEGDGVIKPIEKDFTFTVDSNVNAPTIYNYQPAIINIYFGAATGNVNVTFNNKTEKLDIVSGVATTELKGYAIGENTFEIAYSGDDTFNPFKTTESFEVLDKENATIISSVYQTASQNFIFINVPHATGNITVTVNGKKEVWELVNETVKKDINASDKITELTVSYDGNVRLNPTTSAFYVNLTDYVVNEKTFRNYFDLSNGGKLYDFIEDGITLDFQGKVFVNTNSENEVNIEISKPINIISSTNDAYIDLNCTAGSLLGEHPGSSFVVGRAGSGSNISGIYLHNTELWISNTTNVVFDNISVVVEDQRVGSGVGATSVRDNSTYVTLKNSYFYTRNNGGSTTFTFSWANYCTFDNNTVKVEGNVGNMLYLNVYNIKDLPNTTVSWGSTVPTWPVNNHNVFSNNKLYGKEGSAISVGIMVEGTYNVIANNTLNKTSISTSFGGTGAANNIYYGNVLMQGSGLTAQPNSSVYNNIVPGTLSTGANSVAYHNTVGKMTVASGATAYDNEIEQTMSVAANGVAYNNTVGTTVTVQAGAEVYNNTMGALTISGAAGIAHDNIINGTVAVNGADAIVYGNTIVGDVTLKGNNAIAYGNVIGKVQGNGQRISGTITGASKGAKVYNNTVYKIALTGNDVVVYDNIIRTNILSGNCIELAGDNVLVYGNDAQAQVLLTGNNVTVYKNIIGQSFTIGEEGSSISATVYDNIINNIVTVYGNGSKVYNNTIHDSNGLMIRADNSEFYDNVLIECGITVSSTNVNVHDNDVEARLFVYGSNVEVYNNVFNGLAWGSPSSSRLQGANNINLYNNTFNSGIIMMRASNITFENNTVNNPNDYESSINLIMTTNSTFKNNKLYSTEGNGDVAISGSVESNIIEGNYPLKTILMLSANNITLGDYVQLTIKNDVYPNDYPIQVICNGEVQTVKVMFGTAFAYFWSLPAGEHPIVVMSDAYGDYDKGLNSTVVKVSKLNPVLELNVSDAVIGEDVNVSVSIADAIGTVTFIIDGVETNVELTDLIVSEEIYDEDEDEYFTIESHRGVAIYTIKDIAAGNHSIFAVYSGDAKNEAILNSTTFTLNKVTPSVDVAIADLKLGEDATVTVTIDNGTGKVNIIVDGVESSVDLVDGVATTSISKVTAGTHTVVANYAGDAKNNAVSGLASKTLTVLSTEITDVNVDGDLNINAVLKDSNGNGIEGATILYKIGVQNATVTTGANGTFTIKGEENAKVEIAYDGSDLLFPTTTVISLSDVAPTRVASNITASKLTCYAVDTAAGEKGAMFKVTLSDVSGKLTNVTVQFALNGVIYNATTDENGVASLQININKANTYTCAVSYLGDIKHDASFTAAKVVVNKKKTTITAKAKTFKVKTKTKKYTVTLKTIKGSSANGKTYLKAGKKVTVKVGKKTYTAKTNKKGQVTFKITKLNKKGKYTAVIKFAGDNTYKAVTKKVRISVKK